MRKRIVGVAVAMVLLASIPQKVHAEDFSGEDGWSVSFDGSRMDSNFKSTDIDDAVYQLQPGDTVNLKLLLHNSHEKETDWYMSNEVLKSLEDSQSVAEGGAYSYILTYIEPDGNIRILYSSEAVGGESVNESGEGLHQATDSLKDFFYLDQLGAGASGEIILTVKLEGETQGNEYQNTLAKLQMNFAVEPEGEGPAVSFPKRKLIKTGDTSSILLFAWLTLIAGMVCGGLAIYRIRQNRKESGTEERRGAQ